MGGAVWAAVVLGCMTSTAQSTTPAHPNSTVIFSRSTDENGQTTTTAPAATELAPGGTAATEDERLATAITSFDLDVHLHPADAQIAVRARLTVRNDGKVPLTRIPLQISSSLKWERTRLVEPATQGKELAFQSATVNSDADHTGQLHEAVAKLPQPLAPGAAILLDVTYSGAIEAAAQRLLAIGTPEEAALASDWDRIGADFTGLRGFGNVVWYPVSSSPVLLGDGARLFDEIAAQKQRISGAKFRLHLSVEFPPGQVPTVAVINGHPVELKVTEASGLDQSQEVDGVATASREAAPLGLDAPSLFVAVRTARADANLHAWTLAENDAAAWTAAAKSVTPFLQAWLGERSAAALTLLELPDAQDAPFQSGELLAAPLRMASPAPSPERLNGILVHALVRAWVASPDRPVWLSEGLATFLGTLWVEKQYSRDHALEILEADRAALALAEPASPGQSAGQPLGTATAPVYSRTKAAYVLWMLRDMLGDGALATALQSYNAGTAKTTAAFQKQIQAVASNRDLSWFFADWVDADKGLPDLTIDGVFPEVAAAGNWLVSVHVSNNGYAAAEVPVTVRSIDKSVTERLLVPARGKAVQRLLILGKPVEAQVNDGAVPEIGASVHLTRLDGNTPAGGAPQKQP